MSELSFRDVLEQVKAEGEKERQVIEAAVRVSEIIQKVMETRIRQGLSQRELADLSGIKQPAIARMESLKAIPRLDTLVRIAEALNIEITAEERKVITISEGNKPSSATYRWMPQPESWASYRNLAFQG